MVANYLTTAIHPPPLQVGDEWRQSIQAVVHKYIWAAKKAREQGIATVKYPYKQKKNFNTKWAKDEFQNL